MLDLKRGRPPLGSVLVADDDPAVLRFFSRFLESLRIRPLPASTAAAALLLAHEKRPHLALLDIRLADGDGYSLASALKEQAAIEILLMSAVGEELGEEPRRLASRLGAHGPYDKTLDRRDIAEEARRLLSALSPPAPGRILLVEDDPEMADFLAYALRLQGHEVSRAAEGKEALSLASRAPPDLVVLDLGLPGMDDLEVCSRLKSALKNRRIFRNLLPT